MEAIVVLGAAVWESGPSPTLRSRAVHAAALWHTDKSRIVILCGGLGQHPPTEAAAMATILEAEEVPSEVIRLEDQSGTTFENLLNARDILESEAIRRIVIVTNGYHAVRAKMVARAMGLSTTVVISPDTHGARRPSLSRMVLREIPAVPTYAIRLIKWRVMGRF